MKQTYKYKIIGEINGKVPKTNKEIIKAIKKDLKKI